LRHAPDPPNPVGVGALDDPISGALDDPISGAFDDPISGALDDPFGGVLTVRSGITKRGRG